MDGDLYDVLLGAAPSDPQKQAAVAKQLRRRRSFGELGALTGDRVLQPFGQGLSKQADNYAEQLQATRQMDTDNAQTKSYQDSQVKHSDAVLAETHRKNTLDHIYQMLMASAAQEKAEKTGQPKIPKLRQGDIKDLQDQAQTIGEFKSLEDFIAGGGKFGAHKILEKEDGTGGIPIPGSRGLTNTMARFGFGSEEDKASFAAKQKFDRLYTLASRNALFGATLTPNEMTAWKDANPDIRQSDEQIAKALPVLRKVITNRLQRKVAGLTRENYDEGAINEYADLQGLGIENPASAGQAPMAPSAPKVKRVRVDQFGNALPDGN
jgi:hypothetical protein